MQDNLIYNREHPQNAARQTHMRIIMPESELDKLTMPELWIFVATMVSGAIGGCAAAFSNKKDRKLITMLSLSGYAITGMFGALVAFAFLSTTTEDLVTNLDGIVLLSCLTGFCASVGLAGTNLGFKIILKRLGIEITINVSRIENKKRK